MVAIIKTGNSLCQILNYNENKVKERVAKYIGAANYPTEAASLSITHKLNRLLRQAILNENVIPNSVHISLNFDSLEQHISREKLKEIVNDFIGNIGYDFKFDDLSKIVYNTWIEQKGNYTARRHPLLSILMIFPAVTVELP